MATMADYLDVVTPDYDWTLDITPQNVMVEQGEKNQIVHEYDDGKIQVVTKSDSIFIVTLEWKTITNANAEIILALWHDSAKANGLERTFKWQHPIEDTVYVVQFIEQPLQQKIVGGKPGYKEIPSVKLRVAGKVAST